MGIPTIYRWDDAGAPTLDGLAGSAIAVLQACLVDGYGSKPAAGWTKPFHTGDIAVFQAAAGRVLKLWDDGSHLDTRVVRVAGGASAVDVDTIVDMHPQVADDNVGWLKSPELNATAREWLVIADENRFFFLPHTGSGTLAGSGPYQGIELKLYYYGRYASLKPGDAQNWILWASATTSIGSSQNWAITTCTAITDINSNNNTTSRNGFAADDLGNVGCDAEIIRAVGPNVSASQVMGAAGNRYPDAISGGLWLSQAYFYQPINTREYIRGAWPGLLVPSHPFYRHDADHGFDYLQAHTLQTPYGQRQCFLVPTRDWAWLISNNTTAGAFFLDIESDWDSIEP